MKVALLPTVRQHIAPLGAQLRADDAQECLDQGMSPIEAVWQSWRLSSFATTLLLDGSPVAIGGLVLEPCPSLLAPRGRVGQGWLVTAPGVELVPMSLHRAAKSWLREASKHVDVIWNRVPTSYARSLRWLEALGFKTHTQHAFGVRGAPYYLVTKEA